MARTKAFANRYKNSCANTLRFGYYTPRIAAKVREYRRLQAEGKPCEWPIPRRPDPVKSGNRNSPYIEKWGPLCFTWTPTF